MNYNMKNLKQYISESQDKYSFTLSETKMLYFTEQEKGKILKDMWDKNGQFYKFVKDKVDSLSAVDINDYLDQCLDDDRCLSEFAAYISMVIGRHNFSLEQVKKFMNTENLKD